MRWMGQRCPLQHGKYKSPLARSQCVSHYLPSFHWSDQKKEWTPQTTGNTIHAKRYTLLNIWR